MLELFKQIEEKLGKIFKYDQKILDILDKKNVSLTIEFDGDDTVLTRVLYCKDGISVGVTRYELIVVRRQENGELITDEKMIFEGWEQFLEA